jgi:hypothetical protein
MTLPEISSWIEFPVNNIYWCASSYNIYYQPAIAGSAKLSGSAAIKCRHISALVGGFNCYCGSGTCLRIETIGEKWNETKR